MSVPIGAVALVALGQHNQRDAGKRTSPKKHQCIGCELFQDRFTSAFLWLRKKCCLENGRHGWVQRGSLQSRNSFLTALVDRLTEEGSNVSRCITLYMSNDAASGFATTFVTETGARSRVRHNILKEFGKYQVYEAVPKRPSMSSMIWKWKSVASRAPKFR